MKYPKNIADTFGNVTVCKYSLNEVVLDSPTKKIIKITINIMDNVLKLNVEYIIFFNNGCI